MATAPAYSQERADQARFEMQTQIHNYNLKIRLLGIIQEVLKTWKPGRAFNKTFFDRVRELEPEHSYGSPLTVLLANPMSQLSSSRNIVISHQDGQDFDYSAYIKQENNGVKRHRVEFNLKTNVDGAYHPAELDAEILNDIKIYQNNITSTEKSLNELDAWVTKYNTVDEQVKALLATLEPIDYTVSKHAALLHPQR